MDYGYGVYDIDNVKCLFCRFTEKVQEINALSLTVYFKCGLIFQLLGPSRDT